MEHTNLEDVIPLKLRPLVNKIPYVIELKISVVHLLFCLNKLGNLVSGLRCIRKWPQVIGESFYLCTELG